MHERAPIVVGVGQRTLRDVDLGTAPSPADAMAAAARIAEDDAATKDLLSRVDSVRCVHVLSWDHGDLPGALVSALGLDSAVERVATPIGGNSPAMLLGATADELAEGRRDVVLLAGAECMRSVAQARKHGVELPWSRIEGAPDRTIGTDRFGSTEAELAHGAAFPARIYPLFESALGAARGLSVEEHRRAIGELFAPFTEVAARNPHAWFPVARSAEELVTPSDANRMIAFPYPKRVNAIMAVDQAAAVIVTTVAKARELGIPEDRWVFVRGAADAHDHWTWSERADLTRSPAIEVAGATALAQAGVAIDDVAHLDVYSCFPSAVAIGRAALGIGADDARPLTVTGGLPYFGGPGNDYAMHPIVTLVERLRQDRDGFGLSTALGWYVTKHGVVVLAGRPADGPWRRRPACEVQAEVDGRTATVEVAAAPSGLARVEAATVVYERDGSPRKAIVLGRLDDGRRFLANAPEDRDVLEAMETRVVVGESGVVRAGDPTHEWRPD